MKVREFERLVRESRHRLYGYAVHFLGSREEAEDIVQDAYLRLWSHRSSVRPDGAMGWLISVTRNLCLDKVRRRKVRSAVDVDTEKLSQIAAGGRSPEDNASSSVFEELVADALRQLPDTQRSIVILREMLGMSYNEICDALDLPLTTVKVYLHRGRKELRHHLTRALNEAV